MNSTFCSIVVVSFQGMAICFYTNYGSEKCKLCVFNSVKDVTLSYLMLANVRRYVQLAQSRGGACFCTRGAMQGYDG